MTFQLSCFSIKKWQNCTSSVYLAEYVHANKIQIPIVHLLSSLVSLVFGHQFFQSEVANSGASGTNSFAGHTISGALCDSGFAPFCALGHSFICGLAKGAKVALAHAIKIQNGLLQKVVFAGLASLRVTKPAGKKITGIAQARQIQTALLLALLQA